MKWVKPIPWDTSFIIITHCPMKCLNIAIRKLLFQLKIIFWGDRKFFFIVLLFKTNRIRKLELISLLIKLLLFKLLQWLDFCFHFNYKLLFICSCFNMLFNLRIRILASLSIEFFFPFQQFQKGFLYFTYFWHKNL